MECCLSGLFLNDLVKRLIEVMKWISRIQIASQSKKGLERKWKLKIDLFSFFVSFKFDFKRSFPPDFFLQEKKSKNKSKKYPNVNGENVLPNVVDDVFDSKKEIGLIEFIDNHPMISLC